MYKHNIANFILYDMSKSYVRNSFGVDNGLISKVVEGWNSEVYVTPSENIRFYRDNRRAEKILN